MSENLKPLVKAQYERWPYPQVPFLARIHRDSLWQINLNWIFTRLGREPASHPKIWIAGCGTFQPYPFSRANPTASILATDFSTASISRAKKRCRLHGIKNVEFGMTDLNDPSTYPEGPFDFIECYGVLMSLSNPERVLQEFHQRLKPGGSLRIMVYSHYGRQRIFQIQKLAKLLGLGPQKSEDPKILKRFLSQLCESHPLKSTFFDYPDSKNFPGIVDGFLHASDRGFTGVEISKLLDKAGFDFGFCFHRPWGDPKKMEEKLGFKYSDPAQWLHYLDLWQSLKSNFILCAVPKVDTFQPSANSPQKHPLFNLREKVGFRHQARLLKLSVLGGVLQSRTHEATQRLSGKEVRALLRGKDISPLTREILRPLSERPRSFFSEGIHEPSVSDPWKVSLGKSPNPLYRHLFDVYSLPNFEEQWTKWKTLDRPLENEDQPWGLTPGITYEKHREAIQEWLDKAGSSHLLPISELKLKDESAKINELKLWLSKQRGVTVPKDPVELRILWILLMSHKNLFLDFERVEAL